MPTVNLPDVCAAVLHEASETGARRETNSIFRSVEYANLPSKQGVAGSNPVSRSNQDFPGLRAPRCVLDCLPSRNARQNVA